MWLVGMMGTGKTTSGRLAAATLGVPFWDTDEMVEARLGRPVSEIWDELGETAFRAAESEVVEELKGHGGVAAGGGGVVLDPGSRRIIMEADRVVWLRATAETIAGRVDAGPRPLLREGDLLDRLRELLDDRESLYRSVASDHIETDGIGPEQVADRIVGLWSD
jgi:shikimate kinase